MRYAFVYDGDCGFCKDAVRGLQNQVATPVAWVSYQSLSLDRYGLTEEECRAASQWVDLETGHVSAGYFAFVEALRTSPCAPWQTVAAIMAFSPVAWVGARIYSVIAHSRSLDPRRLRSSTGVSLPDVAAASRRSLRSCQA